MSQLSKYNYVSAKSKKFSLAMVRIILDRLLADSTNGLYLYVENILGEPGETGRVSWDQCLAVQRVLAVDADEVTGTGELSAMVDAGNLNMPTIGTELVKVLRNANFIMERGRIVGVYEEDDA